MLAARAHGAQGFAPRLGLAADPKTLERGTHACRPSQLLPIHSERVGQRSILLAFEHPSLWTAY